MSRYIAVVGSRSLPPVWASRVSMVVRCLAVRGFGVGSGGAVGTDLFALRAVVPAGSSLCRRSVVYLPGSVSQVPRSCRSALSSVAAAGGRVVTGSAQPGCSRRAFVSALFARSRALVAGASVFWGYYNARKSYLQSKEHPSAKARRYIERLQQLETPQQIARAGKALYNLDKSTFRGHEWTAIRATYNKVKAQHRNAA